jgi:hypothetical protein
VLTHTTGLIGLALVPASLAGSWTGKQIVDRLPVELALVAAGVALLIGGSS